MRRRLSDLSALTRVTVLLVLAGLAVWAGCMYCATRVGAEYAARRYLTAHADRAEDLMSRDYIGRRLDERRGQPGYEAYRAELAREAVQAGEFGHSHPIVAGIDWSKDKMESFSATAVYEADGTLIAKGGRGSPAFRYRGKDYPNAGALLDELGPEMAGGRKNWSRREGRDLIIVSASYCYLYDGVAYYSQYYAGPEAYQGPGPEVEFYLASVVYTSPWDTAVRELKGMYRWTLVLTAVVVLAVRRVLRRQLIDLIEQVGHAMEKGEEMLLRGEADRWSWKESRRLARGFEAAMDRWRTDRNEIRRLNTALDYAGTAEENRRQMTSHIAHELKTPLAVIHGYAEGLQEHIAEEKREQYLEVILSESERMDAMVLEMLDLSRLEAGKVKLARDEFDLSALIRRVFKTLERAAEGKELNITLDLPAQYPLRADEARMAQVIENFASNAVKYTPVGGKVAVKLIPWKEKTLFSVTNQAPPLSREALDKVWERFYRADEARSGGGTGLGLAIARSIVELHGGTCRARNTPEGVEFSFTL